MTKKRLKTIIITSGCILLTVAARTAAYVFGHKPKIVENPCWRSCHLANGRCKKSFDTAHEANWQAVKQFILHGEICNPYQVDDKYYTGHSKYARIKSVNPLKCIHK